MRTSLNKICLIAAITFKDCIRNKALYGIFFLGLTLLAVNVVFTGMFTWELGKVAVDVGLSAISLSGLILIFFFNIQIISNDFEKKTVYLILSRPISKSQYILGKYLALSMLIILSGFILGLCSALSFKISLLGFEGFIPQNFTWSFFFIAVLFLTLSLLVLQALTLLWVCMTSHSFIAFLLSLMTYFIGQNFEHVKNIISSTKLIPSDSLQMKVINVTSWIFPNLAAFNLKTAAAYGLPVNAVSLLWTAVYGTSCIGISLLLTVYFFNKRELA